MQILNKIFRFDLKIKDTSHNRHWFQTFDAWPKLDWKLYSPEEFADIENLGMLHIGNNHFFYTPPILEIGKLFTNLLEIKDTSLILQFGDMNKRYILNAKLLFWFLRILGLLRRFQYEQYVKGNYRYDRESITPSCEFKSNELEDK